VAGLRTECEEALIRGLCLGNATNVLDVACQVSRSDDQVDFKSVNTTNYFSVGL
jgi:hypothetical protein